MLKELATSIFSPEKIIAKHIGGHPVKSCELLNYFKSYMTVFNSDTIPTPTNILQVYLHPSQYLIHHQSIDTTHYNRPPLLVVIRHCPKLDIQTLDNFVTPPHFMQRKVKIPPWKTLSEMIYERLLFSNGTKQSKKKIYKLSKLPKTCIRAMPVSVLTISEVRNSISS